MTRKHKVGTANAQARTILGIAAVGILAAVALLSGFARGSARLPEYKIAIQLLNADNSPFNGGVDLFVHQVASSGHASWGPYGAACVGGSISIERDLSLFDPTRAATIDVWPVHAADPNRYIRRYYPNAVDGSRGSAGVTSSPPNANGQRSLVARDVKVIDAPIYGKVLATSGGQPTLFVDIAPAGAMEVGWEFVEHLDATSGNVLTVYSWDLSQHVDVRVRSVDGWGSPQTQLYRGGVSQINLGRYGRLDLTLGAMALVDLEKVVIFSSAGYTSFDPSSFAPDTRALAASYRALSAVELLGSATTPSARSTGEMVPGNYVVEVWRTADFELTNPAPYFSATVVITPGGVDTLVVH